MSTLQNAVWSNISGESLDPKYEKCRNITEEIYKRINITFQIKKLEETGSQSDISNCSDQIDSNELSNETDLFACDKSSLSSSTDQERAISKCEKYININNNEEPKITKVVPPIYKRPRKRFRKRVKKHQTNRNRSDTDGSSDEGLPLSRVDVDTRNSQSASPENVMGVPNIVIVTKDMKSKIKTIKPQQNEMESPKSTSQKSKDCSIKSGNNGAKLASPEKSIDKPNQEWNCSQCSSSFRAEKSLRRHMTMSHLENEEYKKSNPTNKDSTN
ncbi:uncharacterized protein [Battus philenor]|uniref:uncharacterized protein n=1 Tax=Battus philenor TaxID=42288 RepID=UPI0035CEC3CC